jgi:hypothetical protein
MRIHIDLKRVFFMKDKFLENEERKIIIIKNDQIKKALK